MEEDILKRRDSKSVVDSNASLDAFMEYVEAQPVYGNYSYVYFVTT